MISFKTLQARHEELIRKAQTSEDIVDQVKKYIEDVKASSSQIGVASERDQMRANLRYWASYVYERTQTYPNVDLAPATLVQRSKWTLPLSIGGLLVAIAVFANFVANRNNIPATEPTLALPTLNTSGLPSPTLDVSALPTFTFDSTAVPSDTPELIATSQGNVISIQFTSVRDGDLVAPVTRLSGIYTNLPPGSSIHVLIQPLSMGGVRFPVKSYASVAPNVTSGEWSIEAKFGQGEELKVKEDYLISLVAATDEAARQKLVDDSESGLSELPAGVIPFPETVSVSRAAFSAVIDGVRLIYSSFLEDEGNFEVYSSNLDGSDQRRITYTSGVSELFPSLSPDGKRVLYVGRRRDETGKPSYSLEIINSDGTFPTIIVDQQKDFIFERPLWSSDGVYIAYVRGTLSSASQPNWDLSLYDMENKGSTVLIQGNTVGPRYIAWIPNSHEIVFNARIEGTSGFRKIDILAPNDQQLYFNDKEREELQPAISADGAFLAYMQLDNGIGNIYTVDLANQKIQQLTKNQFAGSSPAWAPDGETIFFQFFGDGVYNIWSVSMENRKLVQLTFGVQEAYPFAGYMYALVP